MRRSPGRTGDAPSRAYGHFACSFHRFGNRNRRGTRWRRRPDSNLAVDVNGGCYPQPVTGDLFSQLLLVDPEWSPVLSGTVIDSAPVLIHGTVADVHGLLSGDFPSTHISSDMVAELTLDAADQDRVATGNGSHLAIEWEARALPEFSWPGEGDRTVALGRWIDSP
jgi:hypothetical protein